MATDEIALPEGISTALDVGDRRGNRSWPGEPASVPRVRAWVSGLLGHEHPAEDVVRQLVTELMTNAVRHSRSGAPGALVHVTALVCGDRVRVAVRDQGSTERAPEVRRPGPCATGGRGLLMVERLADEWDWHDAEDGGRVVWFAVGDETGAGAP